MIKFGDIEHLKYNYVVQFISIIIQHEILTNGPCSDGIFLLEDGKTFYYRSTV